MDIIECKRCGQKFKRIDYLLNHLKKQTPCNCDLNNIDRNELINDIKKPKLLTGYQCDYCDKFFNSSQGKYQHKKSCLNKPSIKNDKLTELSEVVQVLLKKNNELEEKLNNISNSNNITNNTTNTQNNINISVKLRDFGKENMDALPESLISTLFMDLRFKELLANLHCDPNYPENQNVRIKSIKRNTMEIFRNNKWDIMTFTNGLTELLLQGHKIFKDYYKKDKTRIIEEDMNEDEIKQVLDQLEQIEKLSKDELKPLLVDLQMMLEEYRENGNAISII